MRDSVRAFVATMVALLPLRARSRKITAAMLYADQHNRRNATDRSKKIATLVQANLHPQLAGGAAARARFADSRPYTVVGGSASTLEPNSTVAVLSIRPDGPRESLLSLIVVVHSTVFKPLAQGLAHEFAKAARASSHASLRVSGQHLDCVIVGVKPAMLCAFVRVICHRDGWHARHEMQSSRLDMALQLRTPLQRLEVLFVSEAIDQLLAPARVSVCLDLQYFDFFPKRDFDEWAFAHKLMGIDRVYVPDQLAYHAQVAMQVARGFAVPTHDLPHRYVTNEGRTGPQRTTYGMKEQFDRVSNYLCLHEHWYDDWIGVAWTPDEYLSFEGLNVPPPNVRTSLVADALDSYAKLRRGRASHEWRFCVPELCMNRPFYSPEAVLDGDSSVWTLPNDGMQVRFSANGQLAVERYTRRFSLLSRSSSNRKCFVHSDWRLSGQVKLHGFPMDSCPIRLMAADACPAGLAPSLRRPCLELCGIWGNATCDECVAPPAPGCGTNPREHMVADGEVMEGLELAHFRQAPAENMKGHVRNTSWLRNMSGVLRRLVDGANPSGHAPARERGSRNDSVVDAYFTEVRRLCTATAAAHVPRSAIKSARQEARDHAADLGYISVGSAASGDGGGPEVEPAPRNLEQLHAAVRVLQHHLSHAWWESSSAHS